MFVIFIVRFAVTSLVTMQTRGAFCFHGC